MNIDISTSNINTVNSVSSSNIVNLNSITDYIFGNNETAISIITQIIDKI